MVVQKTFVTAAEFEQFAALPENRERMFEFIGGEIVEVVSNSYSSLIGLFIGGWLMVFVHQHRLGWVTGADGGYIVAGDRYIPDVGFISKHKQPEPPRATYIPFAPDLTVEVLSPTDNDRDMRIKIANYLSVGTVVWLIDPEKQQVEVYMPGQSVKILTIGMTLEGGEVLPGFTLSIGDIFNQEID